MKLSEISADRTMDILCEVTPHISNIIEDKNLMEVLKNKVKYEEDKKEEIEEKGLELGFKNFMKLIPIIFKDHKNDVQMVLAIMDNVTLKEIQEENIFKNINRINELIQDEEMVSFFTSLQNSEALK